MDIDNVNPVALDVANQVKSLSFRFFTPPEALRLSVRRLTSPHAFDVLGRPIPRGLYDPVLGPTSYEEGPCHTCSLSYGSCPGHFGHIELPFPLPNPLLVDIIYKLIRASCWNCTSFLIPDAELALYLARLYFEDAALPLCAWAVDAFRMFRKTNQQLDAGGIDPIHETGPSCHPIICNWEEFLSDMPHQVYRYLEGVDIHDIEIIEERMLYAARKAWKEAKQEGRLLSERSNGWKEVLAIIFKGAGKCPNCFYPRRKFRKADRGRLFKIGKPHETLITPGEVERQIKQLWMRHTELLELLYGLKGREDNQSDPSPMHMRLFVSVVLVPPSRFRPTAKVGNMTYASEHPQNLFFNGLLKEIAVIMKANEVGVRGEKEQRDDSDEEMPDDRPTKARVALAATDMQVALSSLYDSSGMPSGGGKVQLTGIRQQLEAKAGLFRQHMMGKRVNYSCRSVIGPDVFLDTTEIGIPMDFAKQLTVPEHVTPANLEQMRQAVLNGPDVYPGATAVEDWGPNGEHRVIKFVSSQSTNLLRAQAGLLMQNRMPNGRRVAQENGISHLLSEKMVDDAASQNNFVIPKRVHRHLKSGDIVLFNRQPTLHRVSIMAHKVRVLPGDRTIRFHYANCNSYNADFDGDEMNVHVPQDYISRAEAEELMLCSDHYVVPTSGAPVRGLIQDHIAAATLMSRRDRFFDNETFCQLLYAATENIMMRPQMMNQKYELPIPAILKPIPLWTGKQLITAVLTIIRNGRPGINMEAKSRTKANIVGQEESEVLMRQGELLRGIIDKNALGASMYGIVHAIQEAYGCAASDDYLSCMSRLCLYFLRIHGHTTGVEDLLLQAEGDRRREEILREPVKKVGIDVTNEIFAEMNQTEGASQRLAKTLAEARDMVEDMIRRDGIEAEDRLDTAMQSALNKVSSQVMKACVPSCLQKKFPENGFALMTNTGAKGGAVNAAQISCLLGPTVLEGKRVPRMGGSGATLPCFLPFDASPIAGGFIASRFLTGISPYEFFFHAMSGREGLLDTSLKTANSGYLQRCLIKHMEGVRMHYDGTVRDSDSSVLQFIYGDDGIDPSKSRWTTERMEWGVANKQCFADVNESTDQAVKAVRKNEVAWRAAGIAQDATLLEKMSPCALNKRGAVSEKYNEAINAASQSAADGKKVRNFLEGRYQAAALDPGEAVGVIAAQGVGEPSTQMTLNTFHHAGSSSAHVTLGIPRLRELLMQAARYPKTPSMTLPIRAEKGEEAANTLQKQLQKVKLADLLLQIEVHERSIYFLSGFSDWAVRRVRLRMCFPEEELYKEALGFDFDKIQDCVKEDYLPLLHNRLKSEIAKLAGEERIVLSNDGGAAGMYGRVIQKPDTVDITLGEDLVHMEADSEDEAGSEDEGNQVPAQEEQYASSSDEESEDGDDKANDEEQDVTAKNNDDGEDNEEVKKTKLSKKAKARMRAFQVDSEQVGTESASKKKRPRSGTQTNGSMKIENETEESVVKFGSLGYVVGSVRGVKKKIIEFDWAFPVALLGKMNIAAVLKEAAEATMVMQVHRISKCFVDCSAGQYQVVTEGSNLSAIFRLGEGLVNFARMETNDMHGILRTYGVEAMRAALIAEFVKVFDAYGIPVNIRHLSLIADYMTAHGGYRGFNRMCMNETPSAMQRMTFETSVKFLKESAVNNSVDMAKNPSAAIAMGQVYEGGTGGFQLLHTMAPETGQVASA